MSKKKYLPLYYQWMKEGQLPYPGLCLSLDYPIELEARGILAPDFTSGYWGFNGTNIIGHDVWHRSEYYRRVTLKFTALRQNIVLLLAAMNNEL